MADALQKADIHIDGLVKESGGGHQKDTSAARPVQVIDTTIRKLPPSTSIDPMGKTAGRTSEMIISSYLSINPSSIYPLIIWDAVFNIHDLVVTAFQ